MTEPKDHQNLDPLLDSLLSTYSDAEHRPGLETRILANLRAQATEQPSPLWKQRPFVWIWAGAAATAAVAVLVFMLHTTSTVIQPKQNLQTQAPAVQSPVPAPDSVMKATVPPAGTQSAPGHQPRKSAPAIVADNRPDVFPTPTPLSEQEKLLFRYMAGTPREEIVAQSRPEPEIEIPGSPDDQSSIPATQPGTRSTSQPSNTK